MERVEKSDELPVKHIGPHPGTWHSKCAPPVARRCWRLVESGRMSYFGMQPIPHRVGAMARV